LLSVILAEGGLTKRTHIPGGVTASMLADADALQLGRADHSQDSLASYAAYRGGADRLPWLK
jgi:hypothetical protein